jgi:hypothetical protein
MSQPPKRPRCDEAAVGEQTEAVDTASSSSAALANVSQQGMHLVNGVAVAFSFVCLTMYRVPALLFLLSDRRVAFQGSSDQEICSAHGNWEMSADGTTLKVWFHYAADWARIREHVYVRLPLTNSFELQTTSWHYKAFLMQRI